MTCTVEGCGRKPHKQGVCVTHVRRGVDHEIAHHSYRAPACGYGQCIRKARYFGFCRTHYLQKTSGKPLRPIREYARYGKPRTKCTECDRMSVCRGYCNRCYQRLRVRGVLNVKAVVVSPNAPAGDRADRIVQREIEAGKRCRCGLLKPCNFCTGDTRIHAATNRLEVL